MTYKYFIFDMDETLAELYSIYYFIVSLRLKDTIERNNRTSTNKKLVNSLNDAYKIFVNAILKEEISDKPLGILRPGILNTMKKIYNLQKVDKIHSVIIYSNNGHLQSLEFIRDLIHSYLGTSGLIKECIHLYHPMRDEERFVTPGMPNKTWNVIKNIMANGVCGAPTDLEPKDVFFLMIYTTETSR